MTNYNQYFFLSLYRNCFSKKKKAKKTLFFFSNWGDQLISNPTCRNYFWEPVKNTLYLLFREVREALAKYLRGLLAPCFPLPER